MKWSLWIRLWVSFFGAAALTVAVFRWDSARIFSNVSTTHLKLARQVATQVEGIWLNADRNREKDPLGYALRLMAQGSEPRFYRVMRESFKEPRTGAAEEIATLNMEAALFEYRKVLDTVQNEGVLIQIPFGYLGFLSSRNRLSNDLSILALFVLSFSLFQFLFLRFRAPESRPSMLVGPSKERVDALRTTLMELGGHIREMIRSARQIVVSANESRKTVVHLKGVIEERIANAQDELKSVNEVQGILLQAEVKALNLFVEASKASVPASRVPGQAEELYKQIVLLKKLVNQSEQKIKDFEKSIQPLSSGADQALGAFDSLFGTTQSLDRQIRDTTENLVRQARLVQLVKTSGSPANSESPHSGDSDDDSVAS